ncbi:hypothetical protein scyTo_0000322 [Scyliorhinus torazame]|uniref:Uncharacterized protein n=1 Tax=Scyliorhinus torazame TaxID=75743 RepID=A0A401NV15_SCYTO|nr:hypothetical protein [Scyliorhinus torazame]
MENRPKHTSAPLEEQGTNNQKEFNRGLTISIRSLLDHFDSRECKPNVVKVMRRLRNKRCHALAIRKSAVDKRRQCGEVSTEKRRHQQPTSLGIVPDNEALVDVNVITTFVLWVRSKLPLRMLAT